MLYKGGGTEMDRLTEKTIGCFEYDLKDHEHVIGEFSTYDAFYAYSMAVKRLGQYEDTGLTPEKVIHLKVALAATKAMYDVVCDAEEKTVLLEKLNACHAQLADTQAALAEAVDVLELLISSAVVFADDRVDRIKPSTNGRLETWLRRVRRLCANGRRGGGKVVAKV
jgi:hypothetical protein